MSTDQSKVLFKIWLDPRLEPKWFGPKIFDHRLISHDKANKLQWKFLDLCQLINPKDLCQKCDKLSVKSIDNGNLCDICINNNFSRGCHNMDSNGQKGIYLRTAESKSRQMIRFKSLKLELISDSKITEAFEIVNPSGGINSHPIIDDIIRCHDFNFLGRDRSEKENHLMN